MGESRGEAGVVGGECGCEADWEAGRQACNDPGAYMITELAGSTQT